jgi:2-methylisocitrate lyase-like PEP mutase family enzyme
VAVRDHHERAQVLLALHHRPGGFVLPNVWDAGTARIVEQAGFPAIATTSAGIAFSAGRPDGGLERARMIEAVGRIVESVDVPVTADLEAGYGDGPVDVAATVGEVVALGAVGANLEDLVPGAGGELFPVDEAVARLEAARAAAPTGTFVLNARTDTYLAGWSDDADALFAETVARCERYLGAGADCVFVPGASEAGLIRRLADAIPGPMNVVAGLTGEVLDARTLGDLGVARISVGGSLARAALGFVAEAAAAMAEQGTFAFTEHAIAHGELQRRFGA